MSVERRAGGLTLIEVLVVVGVMAVLVSVLLPALASARGAARLVIGASNARQLALANTAYAGDSDGRYVAGSPGIGGENLVRWHGVRESDGEAFDARGGALTPYLDGRSSSGGVRACPVFADRLEELRMVEDGGFEVGCGGYGYNNAFVGSSPSRRFVGGDVVWEYGVRARERGSRLSDFARPMETVGFADAAIAHSAVVEYSFVEPRFWPQYAQAFRPDPSVHFRQIGGRANVAWLDGRVSQEVRTKTHWSGVYPLDSASVGIGWFGGADSNGLFDYE